MTVPNPHAVIRIVLVRPSVHVPAQLPDVGQLHPPVQLTRVGEKSQVVPVRLFWMRTVPPFIVRFVRVVPVMVIGAVVDWVVS